jgi:hypothetical protein
MGLMLPDLRSEGEGGEIVGGGQTRFVVGDDADGQDVDPSRFLALPLLLLRMPAPLKTVVSEFLETTFDCRVSPMRLGTRTLVHSWEAWIRSAGLPSRGPLAKDVVLSLGFFLPPSSATTPEEDPDTADHQQPPGLKSIDAIIPATELRKFVATGKRVAKTRITDTGTTAGWGWETDLKKRRKLAGRLGEEGWSWRAASPDSGGTSPPRQPFIEALACYMREHLGLNLFHPCVRVVKIACGGFVLSEMRLKVFAPAGEAETAEGEDVSLPTQHGAVLELLGTMVAKARLSTVEGSALEPG